MVFIKYCVLILCVFSVAVVCAQDKVQTQQQLDRAKQESTRIRKEMNAISKKQESVQKQLQETDEEINKLEKQIKQLQQQTKETQENINSLNNQVKELEIKKDVQSKQIEKLVLDYYLNNNDMEPLKLLLNQEDISSVSRILSYYEYVSSARVSQIKGFNKNLQQINLLTEQLSTQKQNLDIQKHKLDDSVLKANEVKSNRQKILTQLKKDYKDKQNRLYAQNEQQIKLQSLLRSIEINLEQEILKNNNNTLGDVVVSTYDSNSAFARAKGGLPWPVQGKIVAKFGSSRGDDNRAKWDGVLLDAPLGRSVKAIYAGKVVFSGWLRGAGMLIIVDHGSKYLSLYGHNQTLLKDKGDNVKAGEVLATVGSSGGLSDSSLYFAIRQNGKAVDPSLWCR